LFLFSQIPFITTKIEKYPYKELELKVTSF